jgi:nitrile hydratase subunit beta
MADPAGEGGMAQFRVGDAVLARSVDPDHHTRLPRYARGQRGEVAEVQGVWPVADDRARACPEPRTEAVYTVRFAARDLWGEGDHWVTLDLWESYLEPAHREKS